MDVSMFLCPFGALEEKPRKRAGEAKRAHEKKHSDVANRAPLFIWLERTIGECTPREIRRQTDLLESFCDASRF
jgi:hypothetical protein